MLLSYYLMCRMSRRRPRSVVLDAPLTMRVTRGPIPTRPLPPGLWGCTGQPTHLPALALICLSRGG